MACDLQVLQLSDFSNRNAHIAACSAVSGDGLDGGMDWIVEDIKGRMYFFAPPAAALTGGFQTRVPAAGQSEEVAPVQRHPPRQHAI